MHYSLGYLPQATMLQATETTKVKLKHQESLFVIKETKSLPQKRMG